VFFPPFSAFFADVLLVVIVTVVVVDVVHVVGVDLVSFDDDIVGLCV
jgi:hypothetical protein